MGALRRVAVDELAALVRRAANFAELSDDVLAASSTCSPAATRPRSSASCGPASCGTGSTAPCGAGPGAQRLAVTNGGTIPDRGLFGVFLPDGTRVGELDEEMVYETRPGETFLLGASTWRIEDITHDRVDRHAGAGPAREDAVLARRRAGPAARARSGGRRVRARRSATRRAGGRSSASASATASTSWPPATSCIPRRAGRGHRRRARRPHDRRRAVPRRDRRLAGVRPLAVRRPGARAVGDGAPGPAGRAVGRRRRADLERRRHRAAPARGRRRAARSTSSPSTPTRSTSSSCRPLPEHGDVRRRGSGSARPGPCCCPAAGPTGARRCGSSARRRPTCWPSPASYPTFPILLEATRECVNDVFDLPALREVLRDLRSRKVRVVAVDTPRASPFAQSLLFGWIAVYMYEGDAPLAERRAAALALDRDLLRDLLGAEELRELLDPDGARRPRARAAAPGRRPPGPRRRRGARPPAPARPAHRSPSSTPRAVAELDVAAAVEPLVAERRAIRVVLPGAATSGSPPPRTPPACATPSASPSRSGCRPRSPIRSTRPLDDLVARFARTHGPFLTEQVAAALGVAGRPGAAGARARSRPRAGSCGASSGPTASSASGATTTCCASSGAGRWPRCAREVEPVDEAALGRFLPAWQGVGTVAARGPRRPRRGARPAAGCGAAGVGARGRRPPGPPRRVPRRPTSTRSAPRARSCGSAPAARRRRRAGAARLPRPGRLCSCPPPAEELRRRGPTHEALRDHLAAAGRVVLARPRRGPSPPPTSPTTTPRCSPPCGTSCGPARSPTTRWRRCGRSSSRPARRGPAGRARAAPGAASADLAARLGPPAGAGRWSLVAPLLEPAPVAHRGGPRPGRPAARALRRAHPRGGARRGRRGRLRRRLPGAQGARGAGPGAAGLLRRRPRCRPVRPARRRRPAADVPRRRARRRRGRRCVVLAAADPAQPYGAAAALARDRRAGRRGPPAPTSCSSTASRSPTSSAAATPLVTFPAAADRPDWPTGLVAAARPGPLPQPRDPHRRRRARSARQPTVADALRAAGWVDSYKGLVRRPKSAGASRGSTDVPRLATRCPRATPSTGSPTGCGRRSSASRSCASRRRGRAARSAGRSRARAIAGVEAVGKHLLVRFDDGVVLRTHLRMTGSWHLYRTGERWRRPAHLAAGRSSRCPAGWRSASPRRSSSSSTTAATVGPTRRPPRPRPVARRPHRRRPRRLPSSAWRASPSPTPRSAPVLLDQRIACGVGNVYKSEVLWACRVDPFAAGRRPSTSRPGAHLLATAATAAAGERRRPAAACDPRRRARRVRPRAAEPCRRCGTPIRMRRQGEQARSHLLVPDVPAGSQASRRS